MSEVKEYYAIVLAPTKIAFRTNATGKRLTTVAHQAAAGLTGIDDYEPRLLQLTEKKDGEPLDTPPIHPVAA